MEVRFAQPLAGIESGGRTCWRQWRRRGSLSASRHPRRASEERLIWIGPDPRGVELKVIAVVLGADEVMVIHAMPTRFGADADWRTLSMVKATESKGRRYVARGGYVDLDKEVVRDANGVRVTADYVGRAVDDVHKALSQRAGRPSLGEPGTRSPVTAVRLPADLRLALMQRATRERRRPSALIREAVERYLAG